jgi:predicted regulator of Ras-like GTPase activity (Roadblock/LC7/MglB family)
MDFNQTLKEVVEQADQGIAATLMGFDGIPVGQHVVQNPPFDLEVLSVEYSQILSSAIQLTEKLQGGALNELLLTSDRFKVIFSLVSKNYFLALLMGTDGNIGKGRYLLNRIAPAIQNEI